MGLLIPGALSLAALAIPIIIFYMLKLRRQPVQVSSLMLWQQVLQDRQANAPWQRLKRNILLLFQLLILALLVLALARPYLTVEAKVQGNVIVLLDASASMQATDVAPNRFAAAQEATLDLINRLDPNDTATLIAVQNIPQVAASATTDRRLLRQAIEAAKASNGPADWETALTLAAANAAALPNATIVVISDGGLGLASETASPDRSTNLLSSLTTPVQFISIGQQARNQGIVTLSLRDGSAGPELFLQAFNAAPTATSRLVEVSVDGQLFDARRLSLPARDSATLTLKELPLSTRQVQVRLVGSDDLLQDDVAWAVRRAAPAPILVVGQGNLFLERALALLPGIQPQRAAPGQPLPQRRFELTIFDRTVPLTGTLPEGNLLFIAPPDSNPLFRVRGTISQTQITNLNQQHALLNYVKLDNLHINQAQAVEAPPWAETIVAANGGPLLFAGQVDGRRVAVLTFDLHQSDLPLQIDFPILMVNLVRWLAQGGSFEQGQILQAGQAFQLPVATDAESLQIIYPTQEQQTLASNTTTFNNTHNLGIYQVIAQDANQAATTFLTEFAVNLLSGEETDTQPNHIESTAGSSSLSPGQRPQGKLEWWWVPALLALIVLLAEWWLYWRGRVQ